MKFTLEYFESLEQEKKRKEILKSMAEQKRMIPLTKEFMQNKKVYDRVWGFLQLNSYIGYDIENHKHRFIYAKEISNFSDFHLKVNTTIYDYTTEKERDYFSYNTCKNCFELLKNMGYITKGTIIDRRHNIVEVYYLEEDFTPFKMIPYDLLEYLMNIKQLNTLKIYTTLLNWYSWYEYKPYTYTFTLEQLSNAIGYTSKHQNKNIDQTLKYFKSCNLISYHKEKIVNPVGQDYYNYFLDKVIKCVPGDSEIQTKPQYEYHSLEEIKNLLAPSENNTGGFVF